MSHWEEGLSSSLRLIKKPFTEGRRPNDAVQLTSDPRK
jgi:hypothetical protein